MINVLMKHLEKMDRAQRIKVALLVVIVVIVMWQIMMLFPEKSSLPIQSKTSPPQAASSNQLSNRVTQSSLVGAEQPSSEREKQLVKLQQETNAKYLVSLSELQMLKLNLQLAELNRSIMRARLDTATDEKKMVQLVEGDAGINQYSAPAQMVVAKSTSVAEEHAPEDKPFLPEFSVISVSQLQGKWTAVLAIQGKYRTVSIGDDLSSENGKVIKIDKAGVVVQNNKQIARVNIIISSI